MSFINRAISNMSEADKSKLGQTGSKINTDGSHAVKIVEAYEIGEDTGMPRFFIKFEDANGKTADTSIFLQNTVGKDKDGNVKAGEYSVNGVKTYLDDENAKYDNIRGIGQIKNLWVAAGLDEAQFGTGVVAGTVTFSQAGVKNIQSWTSLLNKEVTIVTHYLISADGKDPKKAWRNQEVELDNIFDANGYTQAELKAEATETKALEAAVKTAKAGAKIKYSDQKNAACVQELKLVQSGSTGAAPVASTPAAPTGTANPSSNPF